MITLEKFEHLIVASIAQKPIDVEQIGNKGERLDEWILSLSNVSKHQQYIQIKTVLSELLVSQIADSTRLELMARLLPFIERVIEQLRVDYIYEHQSLSDDRQSSINEVRSLYFLMILVYKNVALRAYHQLEHTPSGVASKSWFGDILGSLSLSGGNNKTTLVWSVYHMIRLYVCVLLEYALTYQRVPRIIWQQLNLWYWRAVQGGVATTQMDKMVKTAPKDCICNQYRQACIASFANFFAYRRQDILNAFKVLPLWVKHVDITFEAKPEFKVFVNLLGDHPPEIITPYATVNPYSEEFKCLFLDITRLIDHLKEAEQGKFVTADPQTVFESRLAKIVLIALQRRGDQDKTSRLGQRADLVVGMTSIFEAVTDGEKLESIIRQRGLPPEYHAKSDQEPISPIEEARIFSKSDNLARFHYRTKAVSYDMSQETFDDRGNDEILSASLLPVFGLFALRSHTSEHKNPWRLGVAHWVDRVPEGIEVDGRFLGRILVVAGVRLRKNDGRSQEFVHAFLIDGDGLNQQSTLVVPRYHFKAGDLVVMRIDAKEVGLRLERNLLSTDEIEQYEIVRLNG